MALEYVDSSTEDPPEDVWLMRTDTGGDKFFTDITLMENTIQQYVRQGTLRSIKGVWHLDDGFWVPYAFGFVMHPCGEGK